MAKLLLTIGITAYREGPKLRECWESILGQTDEHWEAVMVLDGNSDRETAKVFHSIAHPRLRKFEFAENRGPYPARTKAICEAQTEWYAHLDADDKLPPNAIKDILNTIESNPAADYVFGSCLTVDDKGTYVRDTTGSAWELVGGTGVLCATAPIRISLFEKLGGFAPELARGGADLDFWIGVAEYGAIGVDANAIIYIRRVSEGSVGVKRQPRNVEIAKTILGRHPVYFSAGDRKRKYLGNVYQKMARFYRAKGNRQSAAEMARLAIENGETLETLTTILKEAQMPLWRYWIRRVSRVTPRLITFGNG